MNAAARLVIQKTNIRQLALSMIVTQSQVLMTSLVIGVVLSALSLIYVTNTTRTLNASIQQSIYEQNKLQVQWGQLLLEKSTLTIQTRVQHVAEQELGMLVPDHKSVMIVNE